jgi:microcystin-dependent protein
MSEAYLGEIRIFAGDFAPSGWMLCQGQTLEISAYQSLYQLIGIMYGGDGKTNFNLPNITGRVPLHSQDAWLGTTMGAETVQLYPIHIPAHSHVENASSLGSQSDQPSGRYLASDSSFWWYTTNAPSTADALATPSTASTGGNQAHDNMLPFLGLNYIISVAGTYPRLQ